MCFVDYAKAFDCVSHSQLWNTMTEMGFPKWPSNWSALMAKLYEDQQSSVRTSAGDTEWFSIKKLREESGKDVQYPTPLPVQRIIRADYET